MRRNPFASWLLLAIASILGIGAPAHAATSCAAGNPNTTSVAETTPTSDFTLDDVNGLATHTKTGLMWKRCSEGQTWNGTTKSCDNVASGKSWRDALVAAKDSTFAGYSDWRLPNRKELESIVEFCGFHPAINQTVFPETPASYFWSGSSYAPNPSFASFVNFLYGGSDVDNKTFAYHVRLVRGGQLLDTFDLLTPYTVTFESNGGAGTMAAQVANVATALTSNSFTRTGYTFNGWNTVAVGGGTAYADGATYAFNEDVTLYAQWTINNYTVAFNSNGGSAVASQSVTYNTTATAPTAPTRAGHTFAGWFTDNTTFANAFVFTTPITANITLYAKWMQSQTISFTSTAPAAAVFGGTYTPTATATSSLTVTFTIDAGSSSVCAIGAGNVVTFLAVGACTINANQAGNATYNAAPQVQQSFAVGKAGQTISLTSTAPSGAFVGGPTYTPTATATSGLAVVFTIDAGSSGVCSISGSVVSFLAVGACTINADQPGNASYNAAPRVMQSVSVAPPPVTLTAAPASVDFGGQSMRTTSSPAQRVTLTNTGGLAVTVASIAASANFAVTHDCATVNPLASCTASVTFTPMTQGPLTGTLNITSVAGTSKTVPLAGTGEFSLVTHYYRSILRRAPDVGGKAFWESEAVRMQGRGVNINETWYAMAQYFYFSPEYTAFNRDDTGFVTDLYNTFFNRGPDAGGLTYWTGELANGMPREVVLAGFMFSSEFVRFTQAIFGNTAARAEVDMVVDFYRGLLARLPDDGGFATWVGLFRVAQCGANPGSQIYAQVEFISHGFTVSGEYLDKGRTNAQYVGDLYNAIFRRGGDLGGVQYWIDELASGRRTRVEIRQAFISTPEFNTRVNAIINQGCLP